MQDYNHAYGYVAALMQQSPETALIDVRLIHDTQKDIPAHHYRGTLPQLWQTIIDYQEQGYGAFININQLDGNGRELSNVQFIRAHVVDLDNISAPMNYQAAANWSVAPSFAVGTSPNKFHVYWSVAPYSSNEYYNGLQRKLRQLFDGDKFVIDPTRVLRLPGTLHLKNRLAPHLVQWWQLGGYGQPLPVETLAASVQHVNVIDGGSGGRHDLGDPELSAPSLDWLRFGLSLIDPNNLNRGEWLATTAAFKQAGWLHADEKTLYDIWSAWCAQYAANDVGENLKNWESVRNTEIGWKSIQRRAPTLVAYEKLGFKGEAPKPLEHQPQPQPTPVPQETPAPVFGDILSEYECKAYFANCFWIGRMGQILTPKGRFMNATQFNGEYGGKVFVIDAQGKTTDEPWKAALRSTLWTVPKVDHIRFVPDQPSYAIINDQLERKGVNTYIPIRIKSKPGDVTPWLRHMEHMLPVESDRQEIYRYFAHNLKFPGYKIPWAPMIQSTEGVGKGFIQEVLETVLGEMYTYSPKAEELVNSGSTFNAWQRGKLMIIVNEIKVDERRELIEILKPMISDRRVEIQSKGVDQEMEDNPANWLFFSNYKDAIPVNSNGRRYAIYYSAIQCRADLVARGMDDDYFTGLFLWLRNGGHEAVAHWLLNYPIERGEIAMRAPITSSHAEAVRVSRGPVEVAISHAVEDALEGFRGGYVSVLAVMKRLKHLGVRQPSQATVQRILETMGYHDIGRAARSYGQESFVEKTQLYAVLADMPAAAFGRLQGYE